MKQWTSNLAGDVVEWHLSKMRTAQCHWHLVSAQRISSHPRINIYLLLPIFLLLITYDLCLCLFDSARIRDSEWVILHTWHVKTNMHACMLNSSVPLILLSYKTITLFILKPQLIHSICNTTFCKYTRRLLHYKHNKKERHSFIRWIHHIYKVLYYICFFN